MRTSHIIYCLVIYLALVSCDFSKDRLKQHIEDMYSAPISIPFERMKCLTKGSLDDSALWKHAKIKLVHYIDSIQCSS